MQREFKMETDKRIQDLEERLLKAETIIARQRATNFSNKKELDFIY